MTRLSFRRLWRRPRASTAPTPVPPAETPEQRAEALLLRHLTPHQRRTYRRRGFFKVCGRDGSLWHLDVRRGSQNVTRTTADGTQLFCSELEDAPRADTLLVQKLFIEATGGRGLPRRVGATLVDEDLFMTDGRRRPPWVDASPPDPIALNQAALRYRRLGQLEEAERLLRRAIAIEDRQVAPDSPKRPHRRNNLALVLLRAEKLVEASRVNATAWRLQAGQHDMTSGRILFVRIALRLLREEPDVGLYLGQLKTLLHRKSLSCRGRIARSWDIPDVLTMLRERLRTADAELLAHAAKALNSRAHLAFLDTFEAWNTASAVPLAARWPND